MVCFVFSLSNYNRDDDKPVFLVVFNFSNIKMNMVMKPQV